MIVLSPSVMLSKLTPLKSILCLIKTPVCFGIAVSDPYLSSASAIADVERISQVESIIQNHGGVGAMAFALPLRNSLDDELRQGDLHAIRKKMLCREGWNVPIGVVIEEQLSLEEAIQIAEEDPDQWDDIDFADKSLSTEAAIALNHFLWIQTGGWRTNTFG